VRSAGPAAGEVQASPEGLQALAERVRPGFRVGAAVALGPLAADPQYARAVVGEFGAVTPENAMKPQFLSPRQGEYSFAEADAVVDLATGAGLAVHGHTLAFGEALPRWMQELPAGTPAERAASGEVLLDYVRTVTAHFRGRLASVDVVNEPLDPDQGPELQENLWFRVLGPDYPALVSRAVAEADPGVAQFVNENGAEAAGERQDALLALVQRANELGGSIAGVGLQAHVYDLETDRIDGEELTATFDRFAAAGFAVRISEHDVTDAEGSEVQAEQYAEVFSACLASPACVSFTTWGVDDRYDWYVDGDGRVRQGHDLLFDDGEPTPAYAAVRRLLEG
jgi:endo-1,4-beta-xylanase